MCRGLPSNCILKFMLILHARPCLLSQLSSSTSVGQMCSMTPGGALKFFYLPARDLANREPGFCSQEMTSRALILRRELYRLHNNWLGFHHFKEYKEAYKEVIDELTQKCCQIFSPIHMTTHTKKLELLPLMSMSISFSNNKLSLNAVYQLEFK